MFMTQNAEALHEVLFFLLEVFESSNLQLLFDFRFWRWSLCCFMSTEGGFAQLVLNVGGPDRLSRAEMAEVVAEVKGYEASLINHVKASTVPSNFQLL